MSNREEKLTSYEHSSNNKKPELGSSKLSSFPIFILCDSCYWYASYFDNTRISLSNICPHCNAKRNELLSSFPIMSNG